MGLTGCTIWAAVRIPTCEEKVLRWKYYLYGLIKARSDCSDGLNGEQRPESLRLFVLSYQIELSLVIIRAIPERDLFSRRGGGDEPYGRLFTESLG